MILSFQICSIEGCNEGDNESQCPVSNMDLNMNSPLNSIAFLPNKNI